MNQQRLPMTIPERDKGLSPHLLRVHLRWAVGFYRRGISRADGAKLRKEYQRKYTDARKALARLE